MTMHKAGLTDPQLVMSEQRTVNKEQERRTVPPLLSPAGRALRGRYTWLGTALVLVLLAAPRISAQNVPYNGNGFPRGQDSMGPLVGDAGTMEMQAKRLDALNALRQKSLVSDTQKLLKLTSELNAQINSAHPSRLTDSQLRMVAEIEKLAHSIREKMCTSVNGLPPIGPPPPMMIPPGME